MAILDNELSDREFNFTDHDFKRVRDLIYEHAGISLSDAKGSMVYSRLSRRIRALGLTSFKSYLDFLQANKKDEEWEAFVNALTTNLTSFYREEHHFPMLADHINSIKGRRPLRLWCSAASTGEEPYTMAITMAELFGSLHPPVEILATDIDTNVLAKASQGVYPIDRVEKIPVEILRKYFLKGSGSNAGLVQVRQELRDLITFKRHNLLDAQWKIEGGFDAIFCRNVMIYFDKPTQYGILKKFIPTMHKDALLFAGHSESFQHASELFKIIRKTVYRIAEQSLPNAVPVK